jgi:cytochrome c5
MKTTAELIWGAAIITGLAATAITSTIAGCAGQRPAAESGTGSVKGSQEAEPAAALEFSGAQLWDMNCAQCHNNRNPKDYSDAQWEVAVQHMRIQARLTGEEERKIAQFLKAAN